MLRSPLGFRRHLRPHRPAPPAKLGLSPSGHMVDGHARFGGSTPLHRGVMIDHVRGEPCPIYPMAPVTMSHLPPGLAWVRGVSAAALA